VTASKEVEPGRHRAANRALTSARWNELPRGPYQPFTQDLNQTLICAVAPRKGEQIRIGLFSKVAVVWPFGNGPSMGGLGP
jgi:hypothetical protein